MLDPLFSVWFWFGSNRPGFFLGTTLLLCVILLMYYEGIQVNLTLGPGGEFPGFKDLTLYAFSHEELPSLLFNAAFLLLCGPCQERRWGTVAFLALSFLSVALLPPLYTLVLFIGGGDASRFCGFSAVLLALFTAQCCQVTQRKLFRCVPVWFLPWLVLLLGLALLPSTPALLHFCAICIGNRYRPSFIGILQELEHLKIFDYIPHGLCINASTRFRLPTYTTSVSSDFQSVPHEQSLSVNHSPLREPPLSNPRAWSEPGLHWPMEVSGILPESQALEEQMLRAGILASLQDTPGDDPNTRVEVPKSSVSSLRLQQLEKMGFPTDKAVVALAASRQLDGAISLLIDDRVGDEAVVIKGKASLHPQRP